MYILKTYFDQSLFDNLDFMQEAVKIAPHELKDASEVVRNSKMVLLAGIVIVRTVICWETDCQ